MAEGIHLPSQGPLVASFDLDDFTRIAVTTDRGTWSVHMPLKDGW